MLELGHQAWRTWYEEVGHQCGVLPMISCVKMKCNWGERERLLSEFYIYIYIYIYIYYYFLSYVVPYILDIVI